MPNDTVIALAVGGAAAVLGYLWYTAQKGQDKPGRMDAVLPGGASLPPGTKGGFYAPEIDEAYPDHPFHGIPLLDQSYDAGWDVMQFWRERAYDPYGHTLLW